jgi:hypothetical protein
MIALPINGHTSIGIRFAYCTDNEFGLQPDSSIRKVMTICSIYIIDKTKEKNDDQRTKDHALGYAFKIPKDMLNKGLGRRMALERALKNCPVTTGNKELRKKIWDRYFKEHNDLQEINNE